MHHGIGNAIRMLLIGVAGLANVSLQLEPRALLNGMGRLVRGESNIRRVTKADSILRCEGQRAHTFAGVSRRATDARANVRHIVSTERGLDTVAVRERRRRMSKAASRCGMYLIRRRLRSRSGLLQRPAARRTSRLNVAIGLTLNRARGLTVFSTIPHLHRLDRICRRRCVGRLAGITLGLSLGLNRRIDLSSG
ncbi:MAG: hypothetical protein AAGK78_07415, partial [Planctomycetota bacterium]